MHLAIPRVIENSIILAWISQLNFSNYIYAWIL